MQTKDWIFRCGASVFGPQFSEPWEFGTIANLSRKSIFHTPKHCLIDETNTTKEHRKKISNLDTHAVEYPLIRCWTGRKIPTISIRWFLALCALHDRPNIPRISTIFHNIAACACQIERALKVLTNSLTYPMLVCVQSYRVCVYMCKVRVRIHIVMPDTRFVHTRCGCVAKFHFPFYYSWNCKTTTTTYDDDDDDDRICTRVCVCIICARYTPKLCVPLCVRPACCSRSVVCVSDLLLGFYMCCVIFRLVWLCGPVDLTFDRRRESCLEVTHTKQKTQPHESNWWTLWAGWHCRCAQRFMASKLDFLTYLHTGAHRKMP